MSKLKRARIWPVFALAFVLRVLPEYVRHQHRAADIGLWVSAFPRGDDE